MDGTPVESPWEPASAFSPSSSRGMDAPQRNRDGGPGYHSSPGPGGPRRQREICLTSFWPGRTLSPGSRVPMRKASDGRLVGAGGVGNAEPGASAECIGGAAFPYPSVAWRGARSSSSHTLAGLAASVFCPDRARIRSSSRLMTVFRTPEHGAEHGAQRWASRVLAGGSAVAPLADVRVIARGTHRTRVSEMRLTATRAATPCPVAPGAGQRQPHATAERDGGRQRRLGTG